MCPPSRLPNLRQGERQFCHVAEAVLMQIPLLALQATFFKWLVDAEVSMSYFSLIVNGIAPLVYIRNVHIQTGNSASSTQP